MDLPPLGLAIHIRSAVPFILSVGQIIDHLAQGLRIGRRGIGLQIDLGGIEPVETVLEDLVQRICIARCQPDQLTIIQHPRDLRPERRAIGVDPEGRGQLPCPFMGQHLVEVRRLENPRLAFGPKGFLNPGIG